jgi:hypothetical protein
MPAIRDKRQIRKGELTYTPITFFEEVRYIWIPTVNGSWILRNTCDNIRPLKGSPIKKIKINAPANDKMIPILEWLSLTL